MFRPVLTKDENVGLGTGRGGWITLAPKSVMWSCVDAEPCCLAIVQYQKRMGLAHCTTRFIILILFRVQKLNYRVSI